MVNGQWSMTLQFPGFYQQDAAFCKAIIHIGIILFFEAGTEERSESVPHSRLERTDILLNELVGSVARLTVNQLDEQFALGEGQFLQLRGVFRL